MPKVEAVKLLSSRSERVEVRLDDGSERVLAAEVVQRAGLRRGDEVTAHRLLEIEREDLAWRARDAAFHLLSYRARTRVELARRLAAKDFPEDVVERCLDELRERGFIDDHAFSASFARDRVRGKPKGARLIARELRARGVEPEVADRAVGEVMSTDSLSELELARRAARGWKPRPNEDGIRARRRLYGFLARRGFTGEVIRAVMDEHLGTDDAPLY